ncbi:MAG: PhnD/SsuA/transferrin family substrate-binding protein [Deltaproteobacteria bacterium]|nr:PhnD/SsuA/transferrin family substrate-binding protein [Deltaproteobacteria bacterium]
MLHGKLRIAPTCYHVLHLVPIMSAHEMNLLYDEGLKATDGSPAYEILPDPMVPFGLEKLGISQAMKEKSVDIALDVQSRTVFFQRARGADLYIIAGWRNQHTNVWVAPPHIKSLADLKGKRVGISDFNSIRHWAIQIQLKKAGLDLERDVEWVRIGVNSRLHMEAIRNGKVECAPVPPWYAEDLKKEGCNALVNPAEQYPDGRPERIIAATGRILEERPDLVKSFLKGLVRAYWFMRDMPKNHEYVNNLEKRLRLQTSDPEERVVTNSSRTARDLEAMPFPLDGKATGFVDMLKEEERLGELNYEVPAIEDVCAQDLVDEAFKELRDRKGLDAEYQRVRTIAQRWGY